jgi:hypothetical protein
MRHAGTGIRARHDGLLASGRGWFCRPAGLRLCRAPRKREEKEDTAREAVRRHEKRGDRDRGMERHRRNQGHGHIVIRERWTNAQYEAGCALCIHIPFLRLHMRELRVQPLCMSAAPSSAHHPDPLIVLLSLPRRLIAT